MNENVSAATPTAADFVLQYASVRQDPGDADTDLDERLTPVLLAREKARCDSAGRGKRVYTGDECVDAVT